MGTYEVLPFTHHWFLMLCLCLGVIWLAQFLHSLLSSNICLSVTNAVTLIHFDKLNKPLQFVNDVAHMQMSGIFLQERHAQFQSSHPCLMWLSGVSGATDACLTKDLFILAN